MKKSIALFIVFVIVIINMVGCYNRVDPVLSYTPFPTLAPIATPRPRVSWTKEYYVDDFNDPTDKSYLRGRFTGSFDNSVVSGSSLTAFLFFDHLLKGQASDCFKIRLCEYGSYIVKYNGIGTKDVYIRIKIDGREAGGAHPDRLSENDIIIKRSSPLFTPIINALNAGKKITLLITVSEYSTSSYRFTIDSSGLDDLEHSWIS